MPINNITQTISTIPPAGARGRDTQTVFVIKQEDFQDHLQGTTVTELNTLKTQLNARIGEINSTTTTMNGYADTASAGASTATTKAGEASTSASGALTSRNQAETFKNSASTSASTATTKASEASASALSASTSASTATTKASEASASALSASTSASTATTKASEVSASASTATTKAGEASASALSASTSASTATTKASEATNKANEATASAVKAGKWADEAYNVEVEIGRYSAKHWAVVAENASTVYTKAEMSGAVGNIMSPLLDIPLKNSLAMKAGVGSTTFTRASTATYIDRYGVLKTADIDAPRFEKEGYLNEGSSTNLLLHSQGISTSPWVVGSAYTVLSNTTETTDPFGTNLAEKSFPKIGTPSFATSSPYQIVNTVAGNTYTQSVFVKPFGPLCGAVRLQPNDEINPANYASVVFYFGNKTMGISSSSGDWTQPIASFEELANGWFRVSVTFTTGTATQVRCRIFPYTSDAKSFTGDGDSGLYIFGAQLEALPFATSYIPTTSSTVTRSADVLQVTRENNFPNAENNKEGYSVAFEYDSLGTRDANQFIWSLYVNGQNYIAGYLDTTSNSLRNLIAKDGVGASNSTIPVNPLGFNKVVQTQSNTLLKQYVNGTLTDTEVNSLGTLGGGVNSLTNITVGGISGLVTGNLFGHISDFKVYDRELTPVEVALL